MAGIKKLDDDKKTEKKSNVEKLLTQILKRMESVDKNTSKAANTKSIKNLTAKSIVEEEAIEKAKQNTRLAKLKADDLEEKIKARAESDKRKAEKDALDIEKKKADMHNKAYSRALKEYNSQLELQQKINELEKSKSDAYKTNSLYRMGSNIASQQSGVVSSIALSTITGGIIDPVLIKNLGLDKPFKALWNMFGRGIGNLFSSGKISKEQGIYKKELEKLNKRMDLLTKKDQFDDGQSVVKRASNPITKLAESFKNFTNEFKKSDTQKVEKEQKKSGNILMKSILGLAFAITALKTNLSNVAGKGIENLLKFFGANDNLASTGGNIIEKAMPGIMLGLPFGARAALIGGVISYGIQSINEFWQEFKANPTEKINNIGDSIKNSGWTENALKGAIGAYGLAATLGFNNSICLKAAAMGAMGMTAVKAVLYASDKVESYITDDSKWENTPLAGNSNYGPWQRAGIATLRAFATPGQMMEDAFSYVLNTRDHLSKNQQQTYTPITNQLPEKWTYDDRVKYGLITDTSNFRSDIPSTKINGVDAIAMSSLGLRGIISKQNTNPYIARENAGRLIALDQYFANKGIDIEYTSAMGGNHVGGKKSHAMGNKIDFVRKDRKPFSKEDLRWLEMNGYIHGNTGAVGWHDAGSGYHVDASIGGYNNVTTIPGKAVVNKTDWTSTRINTPEDNMVEAISSNNILLNNIANNTSTNDGYLETNTNTTQSQQPVQIFNISQSGIGPSDSVYNFGDVAKSIILSTI